MAALRQFRSPKIETLFVAAFALLGLRLGLRPIGDNSTFVHLRTGIEMVGDGSVPRHDPYSFTAHGHPWVVQSWLASLVYGGLVRAWSAHAVVLLHGVLYGVLGGLIARLGRTGDARRTCAAAAVAVGIGVSTWSPRPLAIALVAFALMVLVVEERRAPWWLLPITWVWVNSHGSFVLGGLWLVLLVIAGRREVRRYVPWWVGGFALGALNPIGPRLLVFPLTVLTKSGNFTRVVEWRAPPFRGPLGLVGLVAVAGAIAILAGARRRLPWSDLVPAIAFLTLGLASQRNLAAAGVVLAPVLARALRVQADDNEGAVRGEERVSAVHSMMAVVMAIAAATFVGAALTANALDLDGYPVSALRYVPTGAVRVATTDVAGCFLVLERGADARVFIDDRFDMYPTRVVEDYIALHDGRPASLAILDRYRVTTVLWPRDGPLTAILNGAHETWARSYTGSEWVVFRRT